MPIAPFARGSPTPGRTCSRCHQRPTGGGFWPTAHLHSMSRPGTRQGRRSLLGLGGTGFGRDVPPGRPRRGRTAAERAGPGDSAGVMRAKRAAGAGPWESEEVRFARFRPRRSTSASRDGGKSCPLPLPGRAPPRGGARPPRWRQRCGRPCVTRGRPPRRRCTAPSRASKRWW